MNKHFLGFLGAFFVLLFILVGVYAPFLASSQPIVVVFDGEIYFPFFRYLFYQGYYTKSLDIFFNILMFTLPIMLLGFWKRGFLLFGMTLQIMVFSYVSIFGVKNPTFGEGEGQKKYKEMEKGVSYYIQKKQSDLIEQELFRRGYKGKIETPWEMKKDLWKNHNENLEEAFFLIQKVEFTLMPFIRPYHFEEDAGGDLSMNKLLPFWELTRINHKDLMAALIFGTRISLVVGFLSIFLALLIAVPLGSVVGYYGGKLDIVMSRLLEVWESMPTFFMLLLVVAILQNKSIFLVILVIGLFGWTTFARFIRAEFFKQKARAYVLSAKIIGYPDSTIIFKEILPNAIPPLLTLLPFAMMGAISSEAGLSFLGLGEEGSCSWGVLMDEGRGAFPGESYLLWPPAICLTTLLVAIALVGDATRDAIDPKLKV